MSAIESDPLLALRRRGIPLTAKLALLLLAASVVPLAIATVVNIGRGLNSVRELAEENLQLVAQITATDLDRTVSGVERLQALVSQNERVVQFLLSTPGQREEQRAEAEEALDEVRASEEGALSAFVLDTSARVVLSTIPGAEDTDLSDRNYVQEALAGDSAISRMLLGLSSGDAGVFFSGPVRDEAGTLVGVLILKLEAWRIEVLCRDNWSPAGERGVVSLVDAEGIVLADPDPERRFRSLAPRAADATEKNDAQYRFMRDEIHDLGYPVGLAAVVSHSVTPGSTELVEPETGDETLLSYAPLRTRPWVVVVRRPLLAFEEPLRELRRRQTAVVLLVGLAALGLGYWLSHRFVGPIRNLTATAAQLAAGDYSARATVRSRDEVGTLADTFNEMVPKLQQRAEMADRLAIAETIQRGLLPEHAPGLPGLDIAGFNRPADQTGGDYFDYLVFPEDAEATLAVTVGDITGHGIPAALLMCTARALLRSRATVAQPLAELIGGVNRSLHEDSPGDRFMTLMYAVIERPARRIRLVSAGHDGVLLYDPDTDTFRELEGEDLPLGVQADWAFHEVDFDELPPRSVLVFATDGIWECRAPRVVDDRPAADAEGDAPGDGMTEGEMYGKERLRQYIRTSYGLGAQNMVDGLIAEIDGFRGGADEPQGDDITVVVVKFV